MIINNFFKIYWMLFLKGYLWVLIINSKKIFNFEIKVIVKCCYGF